MDILRYLGGRLALLVAVTLAVGCVTGKEVYESTDALFKKLEAMKEPGYICAPRATALAEAHAHFARTESDYGDTLKAKSHL